MIQKQMMMICSLFLAAEASLPYIYTDRGRLGHGAACWAPMLDPYRTRS